MRGKFNLRALFLIAVVLLGGCIGSEQKSQPTGEYEGQFCGWSTFGKCSSDKDCIVGGCSSQVCQSRFEESIITTCEWKACYDAEKYKLKCRCINGKCQWAGENQ